MFGLKIFKYLLKIPTLIFVVAFVVLNRQETTLYFSPISDPIILPLWIMGLVLFGLGFIVGALLLWLNSWPTYKELRQTKKDLKQAEQDRDDLNDTLHERAIEKLEN
jgi:uncharacterized integral membrane protein